MGTAVICRSAARAVWSRVGRRVQSTCLHVACSFLCGVERVGVCQCLQCSTRDCGLSAFVCEANEFDLRGVGRT